MRASVDNRAITPTVVVVSATTVKATFPPVLGSNSAPVPVTDDAPITFPYILGLSLRYRNLAVRWHISYASRAHKYVNTIIHITSNVKYIVIYAYAYIRYCALCY